MLKHFILDRFSLIDAIFMVLFGMALGNGHMFTAAGILIVNLASMYFQVSVGKILGIAPLNPDARNDIVNQHFGNKMPKVKLPE
jgi:hypothetical protein